MTRKMIKTMLAMIFILLTACASSSFSPNINRKLLPMASNGGISYGLYGMNGEIERGYHFEVDSKTPLEKILSFGNLIEVTRDYKLLIFANYEQLQFSVDQGTPAGWYDFTAEPQEYMQFTITFPPLEDGFYDILFLIVKDPHNKSLEDDYRKQTDLSHLTSMRYSLQVGEEENVKNKSYTSYEGLENTTFDGIFLNQEKDRLLRLLTLECGLLEQPELFIHIGNKLDATKNYAVILLYDWKQIAMGSGDVKYISISGASKVVLPIKLQAVGEKGVHNLTAICVEEPFQQATINSKGAGFSIRIGVNVTD